MALLPGAGETGGAAALPRARVAYPFCSTFFFFFSHWAFQSDIKRAGPRLTKPQKSVSSNFLSGSNAVVGRRSSSCWSAQHGTAERQKES